MSAKLPSQQLAACGALLHYHAQPEGRPMQLPRTPYNGKAPSTQVQQTAAAHISYVFGAPAKDVGLHFLEHSGATLPQHAACTAWDASRVAHSAIRGSQWKAAANTADCWQHAPIAAGTHQLRTRRPRAGGAQGSKQNAGT